MAMPRSPALERRDPGMWHTLQLAMVPIHLDPLQGQLCVWWGDTDLCNFQGPSRRSFHPLVCAPTPPFAEEVEAYLISVHCKVLA